MNQKEKRRFNIVAIIAIILFCIAMSPVSLQNDTFYTVKIGEHILQNGIDMQDPFSWHEGLAYTYPHWLYDVGMYFIYHIGGWTGIYLSTVILACILGITLYLANCKVSKNNLISFAITLGTMYLLRGFIAARAQLVTFILFTLTILCIEQFLDTKKIRYGLGLIIIPVIIANVHLAVWPFYFVLFLPYIAEYLICVISESNFGKRISIAIYTSKMKMLTKKLQKNNMQQEKVALTREKIERLEKKIEQINQAIFKANEQRKQRRNKPYRLQIEKKPMVKWLIVIMIIAAFTGLLTPLHGTPYTYLMDTMEGNTTKSISEHQPLTLINSKDLLVIIILVLAILMFTDTKIRLRDFFMIGGLLLLTFITRRQMSMFFLIGSFVFVKLIDSIFAKYDPEGCDKTVKLVNTMFGRTLLLLFVLVLSLYFARQQRNETFIDANTYPVDASTYLLENLDISTMRLYNEYNYGSYLLYRGIPVFIDSRADLYAPEFNKKGFEDGIGKDIFSDYINISNINTYYEDKFEYYGITHAIVYKNAKLNIFLSRDDNYKELYRDDHFVIYERIVK